MYVKQNNSVSKGRPVDVTVTRWFKGALNGDNGKSSKTRLCRTQFAADINMQALILAYSF